MEKRKIIEFPNIYKTSFFMLLKIGGMKMKSTGMVRAVDKMGRVVIPKEIRRQLKVENDVDSFEIYMDDDKVILKKYQPTCIFCDSLADSVEFGGYNVCKDCIEKLYAIKDKAE